MQPESLSTDRLNYVVCDLCGADDARLVLQKQAAVFDYVFNIVQCRRCSHVYVNPRLVDRAIDALYDEEYYEGKGFDRTVQYATQIQGASLLTHFRDELLTLEEAAGTLEGKTVLDIGCGTGGLVRAMRLRGALAEGFDASPTSLRLARAYGTPIAADSLEELYAQGRSYDIVTAMEVIEHTLSPLAFLQSVKSLVRPGGILFVETGNWNLVRHVRGTPYVMPEGHIHYLTPVTLEAYFRRAGLLQTRTCNYTWAGWRQAGKHLGPAVGLPLTRLAAALVSHVSPGFGPFPIARAPEASVAS